jgi:hypothetical protein
LIEMMIRGRKSTRVAVAVAVVGGGVLSVVSHFALCIGMI